MRVRFSAASRRDMKNIATYIAADSPVRALTFADEIEEACLTLADAPLRHVHLDGFEEFGLRRRPFGNYLIIYSVIGDVVLVRRVLNAAQDFSKVFTKRLD